MKIIAVVSAKGGVGKTTVTANLATALARQSGKTVVAVDLDPQNALGLHFGIPPRELRGLSRATLASQEWRNACFEQGFGIYVLPYGVVTEDDRMALEAHIDGHPDWLVRHLRSLDLPPDAIALLDTPPGPSVYMRQALGAAQLTIIVMLADAASYATLPLMQRLVQTYCAPRADFGDCLYIVNQVNNARQLSKDITRVMRQNVGDHLAGTIHEDQAVCEALAYDKNTLDYDPSSQATHDFIACAERVAASLAKIQKAAQ